MGRLLALTVCLVSLLESTTSLRTGVAPTYIPTMRQMTSYEKSHINTMNELIRFIKIRETAQIKAFHTRESEQSGRDVELIIRNKKKTDAAAKRASNYVLRAQLFDETHNEFRETVINNGKEPQKVQLEAMKEAQQAHTYLTQQTNFHLSSYSTAIEAENDVLQAEKEALWLSLADERRGEQFEFENSVAVEAELPKQEALKAYYIHQTNQARSKTSDMKTQNAKFAAKVPGLTSARDTHSSIKLDDQIMYNDYELQADTAQKSTDRLEAENANLQFLINRFNQANSHLSAINAVLKAEVTTITAERDALKKQADQTRIARNGAQMEGENHEVNWQDMKQNRERLWLELKNRDFTSLVCPVAVQGTYAPKTKAARDAAQALNKGLASTCF